MRSQEFDELVEQVYTDIQNLIRVKGKEYAHDAERFENFIRNGKRLDLNRMTIWAVYFNKHVDAINSYVAEVEKGQIRESSEPIEGRFKDAIVYLLLGLGMVEETQPRKAMSDIERYLYPTLPVLPDGWYYNLEEGAAWKPWPLNLDGPIILDDGSLTFVGNRKTFPTPDKMLIEDNRVATILLFHGVQWIKDGNVKAKFYAIDGKLISAASHKS